MLSPHFCDTSGVTRKITRISGELMRLQHYSTAGKLALATSLIAASLLMAGSASAASKIAVLVNNVPITTNDIARRAKFVKLRRMKGNRRQIARDELVKEALQMQEARRLRRIVPKAQVEAAYVRFAQRNKMPVKVLTQIMTKSGVTVRGFKQFIRAQMSWQAAVGARAGRQGRSRSNTSKDITATLIGGAGKTTEYTIKQVVFVLPRDQLKSKSGARMTEANNFRARYSGCDSALKIATSLRNVTVRDIGRQQAHELPGRWKKEIELTPVGKTTRPLKTEKGVELLAVCKKREVLSKKTAGEEGDWAVAPSNDKEFSVLEKKYMEELRKVAVIKNR